MFGLFVNNATGEHYIQRMHEDTPDQDGHFTCRKEFPIEQEAKDYVVKIRKESTVYAVFYNRSANDGFVQAEDDLSGNWKGNKHGHYNYCGDYASREIASARLADLRGK